MDFIVLPTFKVFESFFSFMDEALDNINTNKKKYKE
jgi:hypothetical protein